MTSRQQESVSSIEHLTSHHIKHPLSFKELILKSNMFKYALLFAFVAAASAQGLQNGAYLAAPGEEGRPEPYAYAYETDTHAAAEQKDPAGRVSGYYTLADADGRQRRVEYVADEGGFRAKVATNEVGTKSENSADVEVQAAQPTAEQLRQTQVVAAQQPLVAQQRVVQQAPLLATSGAYRTGYGYAPAGYGYGYNGYNGYNNGYAYPGAYGYGYNGYSNGYSNGAYRYPNAAYTGYGYSNGYNNGYAYPGAAYGYAGNYNYHTPGQYYRAVAQPIVGRTGAATVAAAPAAINGATSTIVRGYQTAPLAGYQTVQGAGLPAQGNLLGSSNYIVLKAKREATKSS